MQSTFRELSLSPQILSTLDQLGFVTPTEIQRQAIPELLARTSIDMHGQAQTGTGKTLAFGLPLLHRIDVSTKVVQGLIVAPTRELALQICDSLQPFAKSLGISIAPILGGMSMHEQEKALKRGVHLVVGTPGRLNDHIRRKKLNLTTVKTLVLDEADIMLDMGFREEVEEILGVCPPDREVWLFSATVKSGIHDLMRSHMRNPVSVRSTQQVTTTNNTKQFYCVLSSNQRLDAVCRFIEAADEFYGFIFCQTKILTSDVAEELLRRGYKVGALHGDMSQAQRNAVLKKFKNKTLSIVVATDVAARGIDVANLTHVINYSFPDDQESYIHRIGRTGRAGKEGIAITFIGKQELPLVKMISRKNRSIIDPISIPTRGEVITARTEQARSFVNSLLTSEKPVEPALLDLVKDVSIEDAHKLIARLLEAKFFGSLGEDAPQQSFNGSSHEAGQNQPDVTELFMPRGIEEGLTQDMVVDFLTESGIIGKDDITKVRIIRSRTFINVPTAKGYELVEALRGALLAGQPARLGVVRQHGSAMGGDRDRGPRRGGPRRSGGFRDRDGGARDFSAPRDFGGNRDFGSREFGSSRGDFGGFGGGERDGGFGRDRRNRGSRDGSSFGRSRRPMRRDFSAE